MERGDAVEAAEDLGDLGAEDAAIGVKLVDDHQRKAAKEALPAGVMGKDPHVKHVRRGDQHVGRRRADLPAPGRRRVAVVDLHGGQMTQQAFRRRQRGDVFLEPLPLILLQRLQRKEIEGPSLGIGERAGQGRKVVDQGLPAGGGGGEDHVVPLAEELEGPGLVAVERFDPAPAQHRLQGSEIEALGCGDAGVPSRKDLVVTDRFPEIPILPDPVQQSVDARHRLQSPSATRIGDDRPFEFR